MTALKLTVAMPKDKFILNLGDGNDMVKITATGAATTIANNYGDDSYELTGTQVKLKRYTWQHNTNPQ